MPKKCRDNSNSFSYVCGEMTFKKQRLISKKCSYHQYFGFKVELSTQTDPIYLLDYTGEEFKQSEDLVQQYAFITLTTTENPPEVPSCHSGKYRKTSGMY